MNQYEEEELQDCWRQAEQERERQRLYTQNLEVMRIEMEDQGYVGGDPFAHDNMDIEWRKMRENERDPGTPSKSVPAPSQQTWSTLSQQTNLI